MKKDNFFEQKYRNKLEVAGFSLCPDWPSAMMQLEVTNICNHQCLFCTNPSMTRKRMVLDQDLAFRLIREGAHLGIKQLCFHMNGEPLVCDYLPDAVRLAKHLGYTYVFFTTNGSLATKEKLKKIFDAGLDSIKFSINGATRESYQKVHRKDHFERVIENLKFTKEYREKTKKSYRILVSFVVTKYTESEIHDFYDWVQDYADDMLFYHVCSYAGQAQNQLSDLFVDVSKMGLPVFDIVHKAPCAPLFNSVNVTCEGYLSLCCSEVDNLIVAEDLNQMSLKEAWHGKRMQEIRARHLQNQLEGLLCDNCIHNTAKPVMSVNPELYK